MMIRHVCGAVLVLMLCTALSPSVSRGQAQQSGGIVFLHMLLKDGRVELIDSAVRPGDLKARPWSGAEQGIVVDVLSAQGAILWSQAIPDPTVRRLEYEDPAHAGMLVPIIVRKDAAEFSVRIPLLSGIDRVEFSRLESVDGAAGPAVRHTLGVVRLTPGGDVR